MRSVLIKLTALCVALLLVASVNAEDKKKKPKGKQTAGARVFTFPKTIKLTDEQATKLSALKTEYGEKLAAAMKNLNEGIPEEKVKAAAEAVKKARAEKKDRKEIAKLRMEALGLTKEQAKAFRAKNKELNTLRKEINEKKSAILTEEQKALLKKN